MRRRPLILSLAAGAALTVAGCGKRNGEEIISNPPPPPENPDGTPDGGGSDRLPETPPGAEIPRQPENTNPPPPDLDQDPPVGADQDQIVLARLRQTGTGKKSWDDVKSPHPEGATNPPSPVLIVTPDGDCFKRWEGGMIPTGGDRVEVVKQDPQTTPIECPPDRAVKTYEAWVAKGKPDPTIPGFPPKDF